MGRGVRTVGNAAREAIRAAEDAKQKGNGEMELLIGLVVMAIVWVIVIYGSELVNRNVQ